MIDHEAKALAWLRKEPRRIIQSQTWIVTYQILLIQWTSPFCAVLFWLVWGIYPTLIVPLLFIVSMVVFSVYIAGNIIAAFKRNRSSRNLF